MKYSSSNATFSNCIAISNALSSIPKESKILQTSYTPNGEGLFPVELHGNTPTRHYIPNISDLYGRPFGELKEETPAAVQINCAEKSTENEIWENIIKNIFSLFLIKA